VYLSDHLSLALVEVLVLMESSHRI